MPETEPLLAMRVIQNILKVRGKRDTGTFLEVHGLSPEEALRVIHTLEMDAAVAEAREYAREVR